MFKDLTLPLKISCDILRLYFIGIEIVRNLKQIFFCNFENTPPN